MERDYVVSWTYSRRECTVRTRSQIDADLCAGAVSHRFTCVAEVQYVSAVVHDEEQLVTVAKFDCGQRVGT